MRLVSTCMQRAPLLSSLDAAAGKWVGRWRRGEGSCALALLPLYWYHASPLGWGPQEGDWERQVKLDGKV